MKEKLLQMIQAVPEDAVGIILWRGYGCQLNHQNRRTRTDAVKNATGVMFQNQPFEPAPAGAVLPLHLADQELVIEEFLKTAKDYEEYSMAKPELLQYVMEDGTYQDREE